MNIKAQVPNILTAGNLVCGCIGIVMVLSGKVEMAPVAVVLAAVFDFFDGFAARVLKVSSDIGKELDSLADMVSFGVLPAVTVYQLLKANQSNEFLPYIAFLIAVFSAFRLAQFNIDTRQSDKFIGVPTPANALFFTSLVWTASAFPVVVNTYVLVGLTVLFSWLLVSPFEMIALKFKSFGWAGNQPKYLVILMAMLVIVVGGYTLLPLVILLYVFTSILSHLFQTKSPAS
ncbi:MAG: CDP-diacylglycerol--serine O-phosphatidyltransferase [Imperialibacter sp.]|uniref:CDP-diacylglycerol--serine O-phosphatidyltransferase n=1 Tax=Imperialibacter sp. TaxID=2038411 RepID=UPI0032EECEA3